MILNTRTKKIALYRSIVMIYIPIWMITLLFPFGVDAQTKTNQELLTVNLPSPGAMLQPTDAFTPLCLKGLKVFPREPFRFDFFIDRGSSKEDDTALQEQSRTLIKYFLASLTIPDEDLWVNLSPYEKDRIIPEAFGYTEMGRDMLAQDYVLKQLTSSLIYPENDLGQDFWERLYTEAYRKYGRTDIPVDTFHKVWIVPDTATVHVQDGIAYVLDSKLKVMLEEDYFAMNESMKNRKMDHLASESSRGNETSGDKTFQTGMIRDIVIPAIEYEVNTGHHFAPLRQMYHAMILSSWFKQNLKKHILEHVYVGQKKVRGVDVKDRAVKEKIYEQYIEAFKKGVFDYVKEEYDPRMQKVIPRKYFSGGTSFNRQAMDQAMLLRSDEQSLMRTAQAMADDIRVATVIQPTLDRAMLSKGIDFNDLTVEEQNIVLLQASEVRKFFHDYLNAINAIVGLELTFILDFPHNKEPLAELTRLLARMSTDVQNIRTKIHDLSPLDQWGLFRQFQRDHQAILATIEPMLPSQDVSDARELEFVEMLHYVYSEMGPLLKQGISFQLEKTEININEFVKVYVEFDKVEGVDYELDARARNVILADQPKLKRVFDNLVTNARQSFSGQGKVKIETSDIQVDGQDFVQVRVSDTGAGIAPDVIDKIFAPEFTTKGEAGGTGLGLATVKEVVEAHGGKIAVQSQQGDPADLSTFKTTFTVQMPTTDVGQDSRVQQKQAQVEALEGKYPRLFKVLNRANRYAKFNTQSRLYLQGLPSEQVQMIGQVDFGRASVTAPRELFEVFQPLARDGRISPDFHIYSLDQNQDHVTHARDILNRLTAESTEVSRRVSTHQGGIAELFDVLPSEQKFDLLFVQGIRQDMTLNERIISRNRMGAALRTGGRLIWTDVNMTVVFEKDMQGDLVARTLVFDASSDEVGADFKTVQNITNEYINSDMRGMHKSRVLPVLKLLSQAIQSTTGEVQDLQQAFIVDQKSAFIGHVKQTLSLHLASAVDFQDNGQIVFSLDFGHREKAVLGQLDRRILVGQKEESFDAQDIMFSLATTYPEGVLSWGEADSGPSVQDVLNRLTVDGYLTRDGLTETYKLESGQLFLSRNSPWDGQSVYSDYAMLVEVDIDGKKIELEVDLEPLTPEQIGQIRISRRRFIRQTVLGTLGAILGVGFLPSVLVNPEQEAKLDSIQSNPISYLQTRPAPKKDLSGLTSEMDRMWELGQIYFKEMGKEALKEHLAISGYFAYNQMELEDQMFIENLRDLYLANANTIFYRRNTEMKQLQKALTSGDVKTVALGLSADEWAALQQESADFYADLNYLVSQMEIAHFIRILTSQGRINLQVTPLHELKAITAVAKAVYDAGEELTVDQLDAILKQHQLAGISITDKKTQNLRDTFVARQQQVGRAIVETISTDIHLLFYGPLLHMMAVGDAALEPIAVRPLGAEDQESRYANLQGQTFQELEALLNKLDRNTRDELINAFNPAYVEQRLPTQEEMQTVSRLFPAEAGAMHQDLSPFMERYRTMIGHLQQGRSQVATRLQEMPNTLFITDSGSEGAFINQSLRSMQAHLSPLDSDSALLTTDTPARRLDRVGGIDLNPTNMNLVTQGEDYELELPFDPDQVERQPITGFTPVIIHMVPISNIPQLLGLSEQEDSSQISKR